MSSIDKDTLVPGVCAAVTSCLDELRQRIDDDAKETWTDGLLEFVNSHGRKLVIRVQAVQGDIVKLSLNDAAGALVFSLPDNGAIQQTLSSGLHDGLRKLLDNEPGTAEDDTFEHIPPVSAAPQLKLEVRTSKPALIRSLPNLDQISRPEDLFEMTPPYHMIIVAEPRRIIVQGTHPQSLQLMSDYFKKWARKMRGDTSNVSVYASVVMTLH
ncbi:hypothetical protein ANO11243_034430 [Dothideomycetidae sp. 11243]|nr:hypothetical protein ANO11243_034430 [fungal sp. No.11243]